MPEPQAGLEGCYVAIVTPMENDGAVDWKTYKNLINWHVENRTDGIVAAGTTGESPTLTNYEHRKLIAETVRLADGRLPVMAGTGSNCTAEGVELTKQACADGASSCLSVVPYYNRPTQDGLRRHFQESADASSKPVVLYNVPVRSGCDLQDETLFKLAQHPRICGVKDATGDMGRLRNHLDTIGDGFSLFSGDDSSSFAYLLAGGHGVVSVTANVAPAQMSAMVRAARQGNIAKASALELQLAAFHRIQGVQANPIPTKWALHRSGKIAAGIRAPLLPLAEEHRAAVLKAAQTACPELAVRTAEAA